MVEAVVPASSFSAFSALQYLRALERILSPVGVFGIYAAMAK